MHGNMKIVFWECDEDFSNSCIHFRSNIPELNISMELIFIKSKRNGKLLHYDGHLFRVNKRTAGKSYWRCTTSNCRAAVNLDIEEKTILSTTGSHCHAANPADIEVNKFYQDVKMNILDEPNTPIPEIYRKQLSKVNKSAEILSQMPPFNGIKHFMYNVRAAVRPPLPKTVDELNLEGIWKTTLDGRSFLMVDEGTAENRILIFCTKENLQKLCESDKVFMDGTFKVVPTIFKQLYTLHGKYLGKIFPLVFCLLGSKSQKTYIDMFRKIKDLADSYGWSLNIKEAILDFEAGCLNALKVVFTNAAVKGCYFHYSQCIWRKVQDLGLVADYQNDIITRTFIRRLGALPLVPVELLEEVFYVTCEEAPTVNSEKVDSMYFYMLDTWLSEDALFGSTIWNHFCTESERTTNNVEGWHNKFNKKCKESHVNIFRLIEVIKAEQEENETSMRMLEAGHQPPPTKLKYRKLNQKIQHLKAQLSTNIRSTMSYVDAISYCIHLEA